MTETEAIGYAAATLTTVSFVPQAIKVLKEGDTHSLSLGMYSIFTLGVVLWGLYGWVKSDWAMIVANIITGALSSAILFVKIRNDVLHMSRR